MNQTKIESLLEVIISILIGFIVALTFWTFVIVPIYKIPVSFIQNIQITGLFTILSVARGYVVRRYFNAGLHKAVHKFVKDIYQG